MVITPEIALMILVVTPPGLMRISEQDGVGIHRAGRDDHHPREFAPHVHVHAVQRRGAEVGPDRVSGGVEERDVQFVIRGGVGVGFVLLVLCHMHGAPAGDVGNVGGGGGRRDGSVFNAAVGDLVVFGIAAVPEDAALGEIVRVDFDDAVAGAARGGQERFLDIDPNALTDVRGAVGGQHCVRRSGRFFGKRRGEASGEFRVPRGLFDFVREAGRVGVADQLKAVLIGEILRFFLMLAHFGVKK